MEPAFSLLSKWARDVSRLAIKFDPPSTERLTLLKFFRALFASKMFCFLFSFFIWGIVSLYTCMCSIAICCCACIFTITKNICIWLNHIWCQGRRCEKVESGGTSSVVSAARCIINRGYSCIESPIELIKVSFYCFFIYLFHLARYMCRINKLSVVGLCGCCRFVAFPLFPINRSPTRNSERKTRLRTSKKTRLIKIKKTLSTSSLWQRTLTLKIFTKSFLRLSLLPFTKSIIGYFVVCKLAASVEIWAVT